MAINPSASFTNVPTRQFSGAPHRPHYHGFCHSCCHPISKCCCGVRGCRKESKELLVRPLVTITPIIPTFDPAVATTVVEAVAATAAGVPVTDKEAAVPVTDTAAAATATDREQKSSGSAIIGGGCCVHLSVEYMHSQETATATEVVVKVNDSEGTTLAWAKKGFAPGYYIKEGIITTNPGATLTVTVSNAIARVRWCEVFSC